MAAKKEGQWQDTLSIIAEMRAAGHSLGTVSYNAAIDACGKAKQVNRALELFDDLVAAGNVPDAWQPGFDNRSDADAGSWFDGPRGFDAGLDSPDECQLLCASNSECAFFSFEIEPDNLPEARCYLKAAYADPSCGYSERARGFRSALLRPCGR